MTNLDDEIYGVLDDDLGNLASRFIQDDAEVVLFRAQCRFHHVENQSTLDRTL